MFPEIKHGEIPPAADLGFLEGDNDTISAHLAAWSSPNDLRGAFSSEMSQCSVETKHDSGFDLTLDVHPETVGNGHSMTLRSDFW